MIKLAVFHHAFMRLAPDQPSPGGESIFDEQMEWLDRYALAAAATEVHLCMNGGAESEARAKSKAPWPNVRIHVNGYAPRSELPTVRLLQQWLPGHEDWYVLYFHTKGGKFPQGDDWNRRWRHCMQRRCVRDWKQCVKDLDDGFESVGCHWLTPQEFRNMGLNYPMWGGNFWWAKASFLMELPALPPVSDYYHPERWIGTGPRYPHIRDYAHHWPNHAGCSAE